MSNRLKEQGEIDENLQIELERIRAATFTAEWPAGIEASAKDVHFTLRNYKEVFAKLEDRMRSTESTLSALSLDARRAGRLLVPRLQSAP
jgi:hypothetical protein